MRRSSRHGRIRPEHSVVAELADSSSTFHGSRNASPWSGRAVPDHGPEPGYTRIDVRHHLVPAGGAPGDKPLRGDIVDADALLQQLHAGQSQRRDPTPSLRPHFERPGPTLQPHGATIVVSGRFRSALAGPLSLCLISACGPGNATSLPGPSATAQPTDAPAATPHSSSPITNSHVFLIVMENRDYPEAISGSYTTKLAGQYGVATNYHGVAHPSLPNYLAITSGSTWGITDDGFHALPAGGLGSQLTAAGITWRAYMEGMAGDCLRSGYPYALKHNPFPYFGSTCPRQVVPFSHFDVDMAGTTWRGHVLPKYGKGLCLRAYG